jgi:multiple sugar transport system substrate-binding protein
MRKILLLLVAVLLVAACGNETDRVSITFAVGKDPTGYHQQLLEDFEAAHPGLRVKLIEMPESATQQHNSYVTYFSSADASIDVYSVDIIWPSEFGAAGWLLPLDEYFSQDELDEFLPGPVEGCTYEGTLFAIPWFTDAGILYYRRDLLENEELSPPETWDDLLAQSRLLHQEYGVYGFVFQAQQYEGLICNFLEYVWANGGRVLTPSGEVTIDSPEAVEALEFMAALVSQNDITPEGIATYKEEESRQLFTEGKAAFMRNWPYAWALAQSEEKGSEVAGMVGIAPLPHPPGGTSAACLGGWNLAISRYSKHPSESAQFIRFMTSYEAQKTFALEGGRLPTRKALYHDQDVLLRNPHYESLYEAFMTARPRPVTPFYPKLSDLLQIEVHQAIIGAKTPKDALRSAQDQIEKILP